MILHRAPAVGLKLAFSVGGRVSDILVDSLPVTLIYIAGYIGITENQMATTISGSGIR